MQLRTVQKLGLVAMLAGGIACNKSDPDHERAAAQASGEERTHAVDSDGDGRADQSDEVAAVPDHQAEPNPPTRSHAPPKPADVSGDPDAPIDDKVASDNTGRNQRDKTGDTLTPLDQGESETDLEITRRIREAMVGNDGLSFMAKNAKVITRNGRVTLRGPVHSDDERQLIEAAARQVAGQNQVVSQLEVK